MIQSQSSHSYSAILSLPSAMTTSVIKTIKADQWEVEQVVDWIAGLELPVSCFPDYLGKTVNRPKFLKFMAEKNINGAKLLNFMAGDLESIGISRVGDQILFYDAIQSLRNEMESDWITLQILASELSVRCKTYRSQLTNLPKRNRIPTEYLASAAYLLDAGKILLRWLKFPFLGTMEYDEISKKLIRYCFELALSSQRDSFADNIIEEVQYLCTKVIEICDSIIKSRDSFVIQPADALRLTLNRRKKDQDFGFQIERCVLSGKPQVSDVLRFCSDSVHQLQKGDEILQINHQTVVGWNQRGMHSLLYDKDKDNLPKLTVSVTIRRRPQQHALYDMGLRPGGQGKIANHVMEKVVEPEICESEPETIVLSSDLQDAHAQEFRPKVLRRRRATITGAVTKRSSKSPTESSQDNVNVQIHKRPPLNKSNSEAGSIKLDVDDQMDRLSLRTGEAFRRSPSSELKVSKASDNTWKTPKIIDDHDHTSKAEVELSKSSTPMPSPSTKPVIPHSDNVASSSSSPVPTLCGILHLRGQWKFGNSWRAAKAELSQQLLKIGSVSLNLEDFALVKATEVNSRPFAMKLVSRSDDKLVYYLAAESQMEFETWSANIAEASNSKSDTLPFGSVGIIGNMTGSGGLRNYRRSISLSASSPPQTFQSQQMKSRRISLPQHQVDVAKSNSASSLYKPNTIKSNISSITIKSSLKNEFNNLFWNDRNKNVPNGYSNSEEGPSLATTTHQQFQRQSGRCEPDTVPKPRMGVSMISPRSPSKCHSILLSAIDKKEKAGSRICLSCGSELGVEKVNSATQTESSSSDC